VPAGLIDKEDGVCTGHDGLGDLREVQVHRLGIAGRQDQGRALCLALGRPRRRCRWKRCAGHGARLGGCRASAQRRVILFFWPIRASSVNQISILSLSTSFSRAIASRRVAQFFLKSSTTPSAIGDGALSGIRSPATRRRHQLLRA